MQTLRERCIVALAEVGRASAEEVATRVRENRHLVAATLGNLKCAGEVMTCATRRSFTTGRKESIYRLTTAEERLASRADVERAKARARSRGQSTIERRLTKTRVRHSHGGSGTIAPAPYARGYKWGSGLV